MVKYLVFLGSVLFMFRQKLNFSYSGDKMGFPRPDYKCGHNEDIQSYDVGEIQSCKQAFQKGLP